MATLGICHHEEDTVTGKYAQDNDNESVHLEYA